MPDPTPEVRRYMERGLPELEEELAVYREQATGARRGPGDALQDLVPALRQRVCGGGRRARHPPEGPVFQEEVIPPRQSICTAILR